MFVRLNIDIKEPTYVYFDYKIVFVNGLLECFVE